MLVMPMLFEAFSATMPENRTFGGTHLMVTGIGNRRPRERPWQVRQVPASVIEKLRAASGE